MPILKLTTTQYRWAAILWTVALLGAFSIPAANIPNVDPALSIDKVVHVILFLGFGVLWMRALCPPALPAPQLRRRGLALVLGGGAFAGLTEVYQHLMPIRRFGDPYDATANLVGLVAAVIGYYAYHTRQHAPPAAETTEP